ncbi:hypothetical protein D3C78_1869470 [compost metagenome]
MKAAELVKLMSCPPTSAMWKSDLISNCSMGPAIMNLVRWQRSNHGAPAAAAGASICLGSGRKPIFRRDTIAPEAKVQLV